MFTERHASSISALLSDIDGNLYKFITTITTGKDVTKDATFAVKNWASQFDILMNNYGNFKKILINLMNEGICIHQTIHTGILWYFCKPHRDCYFF